MRYDKVLSPRMVAAYAGALAILCAVPAWAGFAIGNQVTMGGQPVFTIAGSAYGFTPEHRAWLAQDALDNALVVAGNKGPSAVTVAREHGALCVLLDGRRVATADGNSAALEHLTAEQLANKWADGIRGFLSDQSRMVAYVTDLTGKNPINATVAIAERRIYVPSGTILPVVLAEPLLSESITVGMPIEGTLTEDVVFGPYALPAQSKLIGIVQEPTPGEFVVAFNTLRTPAGSVVPISGVLAETITKVSTPYLVAAANMPYGEKLRYEGVSETACKVPAQIGIGVTGGTIERLVLRRGENIDLAIGTPMSIILESPQQVAVTLRSVHVHM